MLDRLIRWSLAHRAVVIGLAAAGLPQELRRRAETALGPKFSLPAFHVVVLGEGTLPLALLANPAYAFRLFNLAAAEASAAAGGMGGAAAAIPLWQSALSIALWPLLALMLAIAAFRKVTP